MVIIEVIVGLEDVGDCWIGLEEWLFVDVYCCLGFMIHYGFIYEIYFMEYLFDYFMLILGYLLFISVNIEFIIF